MTEDRDYILERVQMDPNGGCWLGVSKRTAQNYAKDGPSPCAAKAIQYALKYGLE